VLPLLQCGMPYQSDVCYHVGTLGRAAVTILVLLTSLQLHSLVLQDSSSPKQQQTLQASSKAASQTSVLCTIPQLGW
jgi:hypothetical protein